MNFINNDDTIIAPATVPGTGAISLIRISGKDALRICDSLVTFKRGKASQAAPNTIKFGVIYDSDRTAAAHIDAASPCAPSPSSAQIAPQSSLSSPSDNDLPVIDEVLCNIFKAPHSYTGEDSVEIMCHASSYIVGTIIAKAIVLGCRMAAPGEFTQRAFLAGKMDLAQAEAVADVIAAATESSHRVAVNQLRGGFSKELSTLRAQLLEMTSLMELELDFSEEDVEFADRQRLEALLSSAIGHIDNLAKTFKLGNAIKNGIPVAICGPANAGKSTLLNTILGEQRAIVSDIAGTTRDTIEECINVEGVLFRFVDTAGIRRDNVGEIERIGIERSFESIKKSQIVIVLLDALASSKCLASDTTVSNEVTDVIDKVISKIDFDKQKVIFALNKVDLVGNAIDNIFVNTKNIIVSYIENKGINKTLLQKNITFAKISATDINSVNPILSDIAEYEKSRLTSSSAASVLVTNIRHYEALVNANKTLSLVQQGLRSGFPTDLVAEDLRSAISILGSITGEITTTEVLGNIFRNFCIGK